MHQPPAPLEQCLAGMLASAKGTSNRQTETAVERFQHHRPLFRGAMAP